MTRALVVAASTAILIATLVACPPQNLPREMPPADPPSSGFDPPGEPAHTDAAVAAGSGSGSAVTRAGNGAACTAGADCVSGVCEGEGCGPGQGVCAARDRACTFDLREYCGCDGNTFEASGSCPERRFSKRGACPAAGSATGGGSGAVGLLAAGAACLAGAECDSGVCEGKGCGANAPGVCAARSRRCTRDRRAFCGCDGTTFYGSGTCPGQRYADAGTCPAK